MGVTDLWTILDDLVEEKNLDYFSGKRVAVDLSGWVVQAKMCHGLNSSKNPHLRNLIFRVSYLLKNNVFPIMIIEGKAPEIKRDAIVERQIQQGHFKKNITKDICRSTFDRVLKQCQDILQCLGIPCIKSSGEAEALCGLLNSNGVVDAVITNDSDAFLYGAKVVLRNFSIDQKDSQISVYNLESEKNKVNLHRRKLVGLALLLGCDYAKKGVPGIGKENALKLLQELGETDILQRFKEWKNLSESELFPNCNPSHCKKVVHCSRCKHPGNHEKHKKNGCTLCDSTITCYFIVDENTCSCEWHISQKRKNEIKVYNSIKHIPDFPNLKVIDEFLNYCDKMPDQEDLNWKCPDLDKFQEKALFYLNWTRENSHEKCFPLIIHWQLHKLSTKLPKEKLLLPYQPVKIVKKRKVNGKDCFEVQWKKDSETYNSDDELNASQEDKNFHTVEPAKYLENAYPLLVQDFLRSLEITKKKKPTSRKKTADNALGTLKVKPEDVPKHECNVITVFSPEPSPNLSDSFERFLNIPFSDRIKMNIYCSTKQNPTSYMNLCKKTTVFCQLTPPQKSAVLENSSFFNSSSGEWETCTIDTKSQTPVLQTVKANSHLKIDFSNSDDSFMNILLQQKENWEVYKNKSKLLVDNVLYDSNKTRDEHYSPNNFALCQSPRLLYSIKKNDSLFDTPSFTFTTSTPLVETPKKLFSVEFSIHSSPVVSCTMHEPKILFNSLQQESNNDSVICLN